MSDSSVPKMGRSSKNLRRRKAGCRRRKATISAQNASNWSSACSQSSQDSSLSWTVGVVAVLGVAEFVAVRSIGTPWDTKRVTTYERGRRGRCAVVSAVVAGHVGGGIGTVADADLAVGVLEVPFDGVDADHECGGDFEVGAAGGKQLEDLGLAVGQAVGAAGATAGRVGGGGGAPAGGGGGRGEGGLVLGGGELARQDARVGALGDDGGGLADPVAGVGVAPGAGGDGGQGQQCGGSLQPSPVLLGVAERGGRGRLGRGQVAADGQQTGHGQVGGDSGPVACQPVRGS